MDPLGTFISLDIELRYASASILSCMFLFIFFIDSSNYFELFTFKTDPIINFEQ